MKYLFLFMLGITFNIQMEAQNSCDNLYAKAVQYQKTMTIASQRNAIEYFQKAQTCYDSAAKKKLCDSQIATCKNTIALIKKNNQSTNPVPEKQQEKEVEPEINESKTPKENEAPITLSVSESVVKFKAKGGEFKKVKVTCKYNNWKITECPNWVTYSINKDNEIVLEASKNKMKEERSGIIKIECRGTFVTFAVLQSKKGLL